MEPATTIVNVDPEQFDKLFSYMSGVVGVQLSKPSNVSDFTDLLVANADALIAGAEDKDAEGCFQVLFQHIQVPLIGRSC